MPSRCNSCASSRPAGPAPTMPTWVSIIALVPGRAAVQPSPGASCHHRGAWPTAPAPYGRLDSGVMRRDVAQVRLGQAAPEQAAEAMMLALELDHPVMAG